MVAQESRLKNSSTVEKNYRKGYGFTVGLKAHWRLPQEVKLGPFVGRWHIGSGSGGYSVLAKEGSVPVAFTRWRDYAHRSFVNLPVATFPDSGEEIIDPTAMLSFTKRYGLLDNLLANEEDKEWTRFLEREGYIDYLKANEDRLMLVESSPSVETISKEFAGYSSEQVEKLAGTQSLLKYAWRSGDERALAAIDKYLSDGLPVHVEVDGRLRVYVASVQRLILMLFLRDQGEGKTAICANPDCPAPYFLKSRKTQKICEAGECVAWAQRNYSLKWWRENRKKKTAEDAG